MLLGSLMREAGTLVILAVTLIAAPAAADEATPAAPAAPAMQAPAASAAPAVQAPAAPAPAPVPRVAPVGAPYWMPYMPPAVTERRSKGMMVMGIALWGAGGIATGIG